MTRHLRPGGVLVVGPWILPEAWSDRLPVIDVADDGKLLRMDTTHRRGDLTILRMHYVAGGGGITTADERHVLGLSSRDDHLDAATPPAWEPTWDADGLTGRGLLIGVPGRQPG